jgi:hypothetical protein
LPIADLILPIGNRQSAIGNTDLMTPERWRQVEEIFQAALDLSPGERTRYVSEVCAKDTELKRDVEVLLSQYDSAAELLEEPIYGNTELSVLESFI